MFACIQVTHRCCNCRCHCPLNRLSNLMQAAIDWPLQGTFVRHVSKSVMRCSLRSSAWLSACARCAVAGGCDVLLARRPRLSSSCRCGAHFSYEGLPNLSVGQNFDPTSVSLRTKTMCIACVRLLLLLLALKYVSFSAQRSSSSLSWS